VAGEEQRSRSSVVRVEESGKRERAKEERLLIVMPWSYLKKLSHMDNNPLVNVVHIIVKPYSSDLTLLRYQLEKPQLC
jgi:hypothetical protein